MAKQKKTSPDSSPGIIGHQGAQKGNLPDSSVNFAGYRAANPKKCEVLFAFDFKLRYFKWKNEQGCFQHPRLPQNFVLFFSTQKWDGATLMKKVYKNHQGNLALCSKPPTKELKSWSLQTHVQNKYRPSPQPLGKHQVGILTSVVMPKLTWWELLLVWPGWSKGPTILASQPFSGQSNNFDPWLFQALLCKLYVCNISKGNTWACHPSFGSLHVKRETDSRDDCGGWWIINWKSKVTKSPKQDGFTHEQFHISMDNGQITDDLQVKLRHKNKSIVMLNYQEKLAGAAEFVM